MSERYSRLFSLPQNLYAPDSPVVIAAGALLKDNQTGKVLAQLKFRSLSLRRIKALTVEVFPLDVKGNPLGQSIAYQYLDLTAGRDAVFGQKVPILLPDAATREFSVEVREVVFGDRTLWSGTREPWESLPEPIRVWDTVSDPELVKEYRIQYGRKDYVYSECRDLWYCGCGALNRQKASRCHACNAVAADLKLVDWDALNAQKSQRLIAEAQQAEAEKAAALARKEQKKARLKTILRPESGKKPLVFLAIALTAALLLLLAGTLVLPGIRYQQAEAYLAQGQYEQAAAAFEELGDYKDAPIRVLDVYYAQAEALLESGQYEQAIAAFAQLENFKNSVSRIEEGNALILQRELSAAQALRDAGQYEAAIARFQELGAEAEISQTHYVWAEELLASGEAYPAAKKFQALGDYRDAHARFLETWKTLVHQEQGVISVGRSHIAAVKEDGTVVVAGWNSYGRTNVKNWQNIVAVYACSEYTVGLKADGTVVAAGNNGRGQCDVHSWRDIVAVSGGHMHAVGLKGDGTAVTTEYYYSCDVENWQNIVAISASWTHTVGLKGDGTAVATGDNYYGQCNVENWEDIVAISAGWHYTVGLKADGTVVATGKNGDGQCDVENWQDIVAISAGWGHTLGLKADGTVVATGQNEYGECDVEDWQDVVAVSAGDSLSVGLKSDGTVLFAGTYMTSLRNIHSWENLRLPNS